MRRRFILMAVAALGLASCRGGEESAESEAANATLFDTETVDALLGANVARDELATGANVLENEAVGNEAEVADNETD